MSVFEYSVSRLNGENISLKSYEGSVLLVVNVASHCGYTPQYEGLQRLHRSYQSKGFEVLGFPCNQFGQQEPGSGAEIQTFCSTYYSVSFPMFQKIEVNGANAHPLYEYLKGEAPGILGSKSIKWNFTKFLVGRDGSVIKRFATKTKPLQMSAEIEAALERGLSI